MNGRSSTTRKTWKDVDVSLPDVKIHLGVLVEEGETSKIFTNPDDRRTRGYNTGRFG